MTTPDQVLMTRPARPAEITAANGYRFTATRGVTGYTVARHGRDGSVRCLGTIYRLEPAPGKPNPLGGRGYYWQAWHGDDLVGEYRTRRDAAAALDSYDSLGRVVES